MARRKHHARRRPWRGAVALGAFATLLVPLVARAQPAGGPEPSASAGAAEYGGGAGAAPTLDVATPPPEAGAVEFDSGGTGLIRTEVFGEGVGEADPGAGSPALRLEGPYGGIVPGRKDELPRFRRFRRSDRPWVTWIGFQPVGGGRVFLQVTKAVAFNFVQVGETEIHVDLQGARLAFPNTQRLLDTSKFPGAFEQVQARNLPGGGVRVLVRLRRPGRPVVRQQSGYVFIEVP